MVGTTSVVAVNGIAIFNEMAIIKTGTMALLFTTKNNVEFESDLFEVVCGKLQSIVFEQEFASVPCGVQWTHQPSVTMTDVGGNVFSNNIDIFANIHSFFDGLIFNASTNILYTEKLSVSSGHASFIRFSSIHVGRNFLSVQCHLRTCTRDFNSAAAF
jgi:hypothetical protein